MNRHKRLYSLFYRNKKGGKRWNRATNVSLTKYDAIKHWTDRLIADIGDEIREYRLRPIN